MIIICAPNFIHRFMVNLILARQYKFLLHLMFDGRGLQAVKGNTVDSLKIFFISPKWSLAGQRNDLFGVLLDSWRARHMRIILVTKAIFLLLFSKSFDKFLLNWH